MKPGRIWFNSLWLTVALLVVFFGVAFYLRVVLPYSQVFVGDWTKYTTNDAYYFMRQIDNLVHNYPHFFAFDPYQNFPNGTLLNGQNLFVYFASTVIWIIGLGAPSQHTIDVIGAYLPAVLGALTVLPVYFIGKTLFGRWAGLLSAGMIAIMPGEFLGRTILGNTDRDAFEVMLAAITMLFLILAVKSARERKLTFRGLNLHNPAVLTRPLVYSLVLGIGIGTYTLTWRGSFIFILIILVYFVIQSVIDHLKGKSSEYLGITGIATFLVALIVFLIGSRLILVMVSLIFCVLAVTVLSVLAWILAAKKANPTFYPISILVIGAAGLGIFYAASPTLFKEMLNQFSVFIPAGTNLAVMQMQPILFPAGQFSIIPVWGNFTTGIFLIFVSLGILIYGVFKRDEPDIVFFLIWSLILLAATLLTRRIALLFATNVALLMGYLAWQILRFMVNRTSARVPVSPASSITIKKKKNREIETKKVREGFMVRGRIPILTVTVIAVFFLIFFPEFSPAVDAATQTPAYGPSNNWVSALEWLKKNTPEPLGNPAAYDTYYSQPAAYPASAYGVASWWDFGYWIIRIGRRLPVSDPGGGARVQMAQLLTAQNEIAASQILDGLKVKYVVIDDSTIGSKFGGVATYAGIDLSQFGDIYYVNSSGKMTQVIYYYPQYFQSMAIRLYRFDGKKVVPTNTPVISYQDKVSPDGQPYKEVINTSNFASYEEAAAFIAKQKSGNYKIVSNSVSQSPVPLESLSHLKEIYSPNQADPAAVKIFEYTK
jgi:dolichyl-phosphooligosaccharide-protein glycotransferase